MGNHSTKRPILHNLKLPVGGFPPGNFETLPEGKTLTPPVISGNLGNIHRLLARHQLKDRVKLLENIIKTHQPLVQAMQVTQKAFQQGVMEGIRQVAAAEREKEQTVQELQPAETSFDNDKNS